MGFAESNIWQPTAGFMTHVTCRLSAKHRDQLPNTTLGNRVRAAFTFLYIRCDAAIKLLSMKIICVYSYGAVDLADLCQLSSAR